MKYNPFDLRTDEQLFNGETPKVYVSYDSKLPQTYGLETVQWLKMDRGNSDKGNRRMKVVNNNQI